ncbi:SDR family NAD(P)-dependent oxidoreductase [Streptomyces nojiriensis]|uniref:SDR family NAD(P)-dependent oxidoreductase n=1 Tax=Streptomyces nojiriensis TaxID=66374 RepID=UPI0035DC6D72
MSSRGGRRVRRHSPFGRHLEETRDEAVFVTGTSSGIGRAIALDLAGRSVTVFAGVRRAGDAPKGDGLPGAVHEILLDVTSGSQITEAADSIRRLLGRQRLRGVVNNAGAATGGPLEYVTIDEMRHQFEVNVFGQLAVTQAVLDLIRDHGDGRVLFTSSIAGHIAAPCFGPYAASKHALNGMAESMRRELRPWNIRVSVLVPGAVATPIWSKADHSVQGLTDRLPTRAKELYGSTLENMRRYMASAAAGRSISPSVVARAARHALYARQPKAVYLMGAEARAGVALSTALPTRVFDALLARQLSRSPSR